MLNINKIGLVRYKTVKMATLKYFSHTKCPIYFSLKVTTSQFLSDCRWRRCAHLKMFRDKGKAQCVLWFPEKKSLLSVQRKFRNEKRKAPDVKNIRRRFEHSKKQAMSVRESHLEDVQLYKRM